MDTVNPFQVIDSQTLMDMDFMPLNFVVKGLIAQGLHILAGAPKAGKSWMALWLCLCVAKGDPVWDLETQKGTVLYLCLEDSQPRIQNRLFDITDNAPSNLFFATASLPIGKGLENQIDNFIELHTDTVLIVIDTFQMVRQISIDSGYANDYKELTSLKKLADKYKMAILLIHHLRKEEDKNTFNMISGTTGIQGAVDSSFTLIEEKYGGGKAILSCIGRDIEYREISLIRSENNIWKKTKDSLENNMSEDSIVTILSLFMNDKTEIKEEPAILAKLLSDSSGEIISHLSLLKRMRKNSAELLKSGISFNSRQSNGRRLIEIFKVPENK